MIVFVSTIFLERFIFFGQHLYVVWVPFTALFWIVIGQNLFKFIYILHEIIVLFLAGMIFLSFEVGVWGAIAGLLALLTIVPLQFGLGEKISSLRQQTIKITDSRVRLMNEILNAIKVVKLYCWEESFSNQVHLSYFLIHTSYFFDYVNKSTAVIHFCVNKWHF